MINLKNVADDVFSAGGYGYGINGYTPIQQKLILKAMKEACRQTLELAAEKAEVEEFWRGESYRIDTTFYDNEDGYIAANKQSVLDVINLIE